MTLADKVKQRAAELHTEIIAIREHLHQNPELSFQEHKTAAFISNKLSAHGIIHSTGIAGTGISGLIENPTLSENIPTLALRADMDALPITEENNHHFVSKNPGVMHACGHDVHSACLLGCLIILHEFREYLNCKVKFLFQPGEEKLPGGASLMIQEGVLQNPAVSAIVGQHVSPEIEAGKVGFREGMYMASADEIYLTVTGKGGHGAMPHQVVDPILITANILTGLQQVVSRKANPAIPSVLSFGKIVANGATNVIPDQVTLEGTFRTFDEEWRSKAHKLITEFCEKTAQAAGGTCSVTIEKGYPFLKNDVLLTGRTRSAAEEYLGKDNVLDLDLRTTAEDFAWYSQHVPACFYRLGVRNESKGIIHGVHNSRFNADNHSLETGMGLMAYIALSRLDAII